MKNLKTVLKNEKEKLVLAFVNEHQNLVTWQVETVRRFADTLPDKENFLRLFMSKEGTGHYQLPTMSRAWFFPKPVQVKKYSVPFEGGAFLFCQKQWREEGGLILRVHALWISQHVSKSLSRELTKAFEDMLTAFARTQGIDEIGFYTNRNPHAFIKRLNKTSPNPWTLDSYVIKRKV